jgi:hypothetical protein
MRNNKGNEKVNQPSIILVPGKMATLFFYMAIFLLTLNLAGIIFQKILGYNNFITTALVYFFDASLEYNIPALFSTLILFISSILLFIIYFISRQKNQKHLKFWLLLGFIFLFLSVDEATAIHERFNKFSGYPDYAWTWILPYGVFVVVGAIFFFRFLFSLASKARKLFIIAGSVYVFATMGFEPIEGYFISAYGPSYKYFLLCAVEEFLEMAGIILFIYALLDYISVFNLSLKITNRKEHVERPALKKNTIAQTSRHLIEESETT